VEVDVCLFFLKKAMAPWWYRHEVAMWTHWQGNGRYELRISRFLLSSQKKITVIVLDDDLSVCRALKMQLEVLGFEVTVCHSAEELIARVIPCGNVCLLADVYLPGMNGVDLCQRLTAQGTRIPVILMSGRDDKRTTRLMRDANAVARLFKPFNERSLLRAIRRAIPKQDSKLRS
jgi:FixJ family two-component response regulator